MYTAQPLKGFNPLEQGAGELNIDGAVRVAKLVKSTASTLTSGSAMLTTSLPSSQTSTIAGQTCYWSRGVITNYGFLYGDNLMKNWQGIYASGVVLSDGTYVSAGTLVPTSGKVSSGVSTCRGPVTNNGVVLSDGVILADGRTRSDYTPRTDSILGDSMASMPPSPWIGAQLDVWRQQLLRDLPKSRGSHSSSVVISVRFWQIAQHFRTRN